MADDELKCKVLFFAAAAEAVGCRSIEMTMKHSTTVCDLVDTIGSMHEKFDAVKEWCAFAIDQKLCSIDTPLSDGCEVAFLPPVSGG